MVRWLLYGLLAGIGLAILVIGLFGVAIAGICDTGCPSDAALVAYKVMAAAGLVAAIGGVAGLVSLVAGRKRRR
jgi:hypothetical protein